MTAAFRLTILVMALLTIGCPRPAPGVADNEVVGKPRAQPAARSRNAIWYRISVDSQFLDVAVRLFSPPDQTRFFLPGEWAGQRTYGDAIRIAGAFGPEGSRELRIVRERGEVEVDSRSLPWIELRYRVELSERSAFHPRWVDGALLAFGITFLVTPAEQYLDHTESIPIEVVTPSDWTTVSTWPLAAEFPSSHSGRTVRTYVARDAAELREAFLVAGHDIRIVETTVDDSPVKVAFGSGFTGDTEDFTRFVGTMTRTYGVDYGTTGPVHVYVSTGTDENEQLSGVGRRNGFVVKVPAREPMSEAARLLVAHEALHLWNGHKLVPKPEFEASTRWFKEGVTHYLALKTLAATGNVTERFVLTELAKSATNYAHNPLSRGGEGSALDRARFPYDFGVLVALSVDAGLAADSDGAVSVRDWLAALTSRELRTYDEQDLLVALQSVAPRLQGTSRAEDVWRRVVRVREPIELRELFASIGLHWLPPRGTDGGRLVPLARQTAPFLQLFRFPTSEDARQ